MNSLISQLKMLGDVIPEPSREKELKERLIHKIQGASYKSSRSPFEPLMMLLFSQRLVRVIGTGVLFIMGGIFALGTGTVIGARFTDPGEPLYKVRLTFEHMPLILLSEEEKVSAELRFAERRQQEIETIIESNENDEDKAKKIKVAAEEFYRSIASTQKRVEKIGLNPTSNSTEVVTEAHEGVIGIKKSLNKVAQSIEQKEINHETTEVLRIATDTITKAELSTSGVLFELYGKGEEEASVAIGMKGQEEEQVLEEGNNDAVSVNLPNKEEEGNKVEDDSLVDNESQDIIVPIGVSEIVNSTTTAGTGAL